MEHGKRVKDLCRRISECVRRGELTKQQGRTIIGQAKHGDYAGALRGAERVLRKALAE